MESLPTSVSSSTTPRAPHFTPASMASYTPGLSWPRSDGDPNSWPTAEEQRPSQVNSWQEKLDLSHEKYKLYEGRIGEKLAELKGIKAASYRVQLPAGYALFAHHKPNPDKGERVDVYLRGCPTIGKKYFRSPNEFLPHAEWILDTSRSIDDHSKCGCIYNNVSAAAQAKKSGSSSLGTGATPKPTPSVPKKRKEAPEEPEEPPAVIVPERLIDIQTGRRFRKGELVWFQIETIHPPPDRPNLPRLTHWPGLVANAAKKLIPDPTNSKPTDNGLPQGVSSTLAHLSGGSTATPPPKRFVTTWDYSIRPLGFFSPSAEVAKRPEGLLPYSVGSDLLGGSKGWGAIGKEGTRVIKERVAAEVNDLKGKGLPLPSDPLEIDKKWKEKMARRYPFKEMPKEWDTVVFRLGIAIKIASLISNSWTQTDKIDIVPGTDINQDDLEAITSQRKTLYQGLWWGGERIWVDDTVRLKKHRAELPVDALGLPSEGAADRAVLLKIRMITVEVSPDSTEERHAWRALLYGHVFEVANGDAPTIDPKADPEWAAAVAVPPKGYHFKQLNEAGSEVTVDIMDVAGRVYSDLFEPNTQTTFKSSSLSDPENGVREPVGESGRALTGLKPGQMVASKSDKWKEDLYTIVSEANKSTERDMKKFFMNLLNPAAASEGAKADSNGVREATAADGVGAATGEAEAAPASAA